MAILTRTFDRSYYRNGEAIHVTIQITPNAGVKAYGIEEHCPSWPISAVDNSGSSFPGVIKWGVFFDATPRTFHYTLTPPAGEHSLGVFSGVVSFDGVSQAIQGSQNIGLDNVPPAPPK